MKDVPGRHVEFVLAGANRRELVLGVDRQGHSVDGMRTAISPAFDAGKLGHSLWTRYRSADLSSSVCADRRASLPYDPPMSGTSTGRVPPARARLIGAGLAILGEGGQHLLRRLITADDVSRRARVSRRTFYDNFETTEEFLGALRVYVEGGEGSPDVVDGGTLDVRARVGELLDVAAGLNSAASRVIRAVQGVAWVPDVAVGAVLIDSIRRFIDALDARGRLLWADLDRDEAVQLIAAVLDGIALDFGSRALDESRDLLVDAVLRFLGAMTEGSSGRAPHADSGMDLVNSVMQNDASDRDPVASMRLRMLVLDRAVDEFREAGYHDASVERIALRSGVSDQTVRDLFGTKIQLACEVVTTFVRLEDSDGLASVMDPLGAAKMLLDSVIAAVQETPLMGEVVLVLAAASRSTNGSQAIVDELAAQLADAGLGSRLISADVLACTGLTMATTLGMEHPDIDSSLFAAMVLKALQLW